MWGCEKVSLDEPVKDDSLLTDYVLPEILYASMSDDGKDSETRTYVGGGNGKSVLWHSGDEISYFSGDTHADYVSQGEGKLSVEFIKGDKEPATLESTVDGTVESLDEAVRHHTHMQVGRILAYPHVAEKIEKGELLVKTADYDVNTGKVTY